MRRPRKLERAGLHDDILRKLTAAGIRTTRDLLCRNELEVMHILDASWDTVRGILLQVSQRVLPPCQTVLEMVLEGQHHFLPTHLPELDRALRGGLPFGSITEVVGPSGVGKTQFCLMMSVLAVGHWILPSEDRGTGGGGVVYIDTEQTFSVQRLVEIATAQAPAFWTEEQIVRLASCVHVIRPRSLLELSQTLESLETLMIEKHGKLVVVDSVAAIIRHEFDASSLMQRQNVLSTEASVLKFLAEAFQVPVLVTNQVTTRINDTARAADTARDPHKPYLTAALGNTWSHAVNSRLVFEEHQGRRLMTIAKSPLAPVLQIEYVIGARGIESIGASSVQTNYWDHHIENALYAEGADPQGQHAIMAENQGLSL